MTASISSWLRLNFGFRGADTERHGAHASLMIDTGPDRGFNLMDMGFGMSQLLPVVAQRGLEPTAPFEPGPFVLGS